MNDTFMKEKPVLPLILSMTLPMVLSMLVNSLYNIIDSFFVAQISEEAMMALSLVYPVQNFIMSADPRTVDGAPTQKRRFRPEKPPYASSGPGLSSRRFLLHLPERLASGMRFGSRKRLLRSFPLSFTARQSQ